MQQNNITSNNRIHVIRNDRVDALDYQHMIKNVMHIRRPLMIKLKKNAWAVIKYFILSNRTAWKDFMLFTHIVEQVL